MFRFFDGDKFACRVYEVNTILLIEVIASGNVEDAGKSRPGDDLQYDVLTEKLSKENWLPLLYGSYKNFPKIMARHSLSGDLFDALLGHISHGIVLVGPDMEVLAVNQRMVDLFQLPEGTFSIGDDFHQVLRIWAKETGQNTQMLELAISETYLRTPFSFEFEQLILGQRRWCQLHHDPLPKGGFVRTFTDITEHKTLEEALRHQANTDYLTQLYNRRYFLQCAERELAAARRYERELSLLFFDIDLFKQINDRYGHAVGDRALKRLADLCRETFRNVDVIGRFGGEEFVVLMPDTSLVEATTAAERLRAAIAEARIAADNGQYVSLTISAGVSGWTSANETIADVLNSADQLLYAAKRLGRNRVVAADQHSSEV